MSLNQRNSFNNILKEASKEEFYWATRMINFVDAYHNNSHPPMKPVMLKEILLKDVELFKLLEGVPESHIKHIINEVSSSFSLKIVRWLGYVLVKILTRTVPNLYVNETSLIQVRDTMGSNPLIFLPTHRSYGDFILMAFICFHYNIQLPYVAAGMDFHSMQIMGEVLRHCKAFFMRRKFADDQIYKTIFQKYFQLLIQSGESPIEFFIEGTRSRSAKSLSPKFGLLTMALETYVNGLVPDITIIPISISYDRILEEKLFAYELLGIPKPKESTMGLLNAFRKMNGSYGSFYFNFGEAISVRDWITKNFSVTKGNENKIQISTITHRLAHHVIQRQNDLHIFGIFNVLAIVMSYSIWNLNSCSISFEDAMSEVELLCQLFKRRSAVIHYEGGLRDALITACKVHSTLLVHSVDDKITFKKSFSTQVGDVSSLEGLLNERSVNEILPVVMLQLYINPCLHVFVPPALILFSFWPAKTLFNGSVQDAYNYIKEVFKCEFVTLNNVDDKDIYNEALVFLRDTECIDAKTGELGPNNKVRFILQHLLQPFIAGYSIMAQTILEMSLRRILASQDAILMYSQKVARNSIAERQMHPYCLSRDMLKNALESFRLLKYITKNVSNTEIQYLPNEKQLLRLISFLDTSEIFIVDHYQRTSEIANKKEPMCRL